MGLFLLPVAHDALLWLLFFFLTMAVVFRFMALRTNKQRWMNELGYQLL